MRAPFPSYVCSVCSPAVRTFGLTAVQRRCWSPSRAPSTRSSGAPRPSLPEQTTGSAKPIDGYREILARPLFSKTREPFVARPAAAIVPQPPNLRPPPLPPADPGISVAGIMISGITREAYLVKKPSSRGTWVREGAEFMGWTVQSISAGIATLQQSNRTIELRLYAEK